MISVAGALHKPRNDIAGEITALQTVSEFLITVAIFYIAAGTVRGVHPAVTALAEYDGAIFLQGTAPLDGIQIIETVPAV
jgi:hypothetical protein